MGKGKNVPYLVIRVFLRHTGLDVVHEGVDEAAALSHCLPLLLLGAAQVPTHIYNHSFKFEKETLITF